MRLLKSIKNKMNVQIQRTAEALDQGHHAALCLGLCEARIVG